MLYMLCDLREPSLSRAVLEARKYGGCELQIDHVRTNGLVKQLQTVINGIGQHDKIFVCLLSISDNELKETINFLSNSSISTLKTLRFCGSQYHADFKASVTSIGFQYENNKYEALIENSTVSEIGANGVSVSERRWIQYSLMRTLIAGECPQKSFEKILIQLSKRKLSSLEELQSKRFFELGQPDMAGGSYAKERKINPNAIDSLRDRAIKVARSGLNALITGETGTGKESIAWYLHDFSSRKYKPFLAMNCAFFEGDRLESELFGHEQGAFTDAKRAKKGLVEEADGGTIFLDELPEMIPRVQAKLLRFLQDGTFTRLGGIKTLKSNVRIISAAQPHLLTQIRADLFHRIADVELQTTPLRNMKPQAIVNIACNLAYRLMWTTIQTEDGEKVLTPDVIRQVWAELALPENSSALSSCSWPGNMRELASAVKRYVLLDDDIFEELRIKASGFASATDSPIESGLYDEKWKQFVLPVDNMDDLKSLDLKLRQIQAAYLRNLVANLGGRENVSFSKLASFLDCSYNTLSKYLN